jgi:hypothetical protein
LSLEHKEMLYFRSSAQMSSKLGLSEGSLCPHLSANFGTLNC